MKNLMIVLIALISAGSTQAIVGGRNTTADQYPWYVKLNSSTGWCGGAIIRDRAILTAAHCVVGHIGEVNFVSGGGSGIVGDLQVLGEVDQYVTHKQYQMFG